MTIVTEQRVRCDPGPRTESYGSRQLHLRMRRPRFGRLGGNPHRTGSKEPFGTASALTCRAWARVPRGGPQVAGSRRREPSSSLEPDSTLHLVVAAAAAGFGVYQWSRQRGRVRVQLLGSQSALHLSVVVDAPTSVRVNGLNFHVKGRGHLRRLLGWLGKSRYDGPTQLRRRLAAIWRYRDIDIAMGWLERTAPRDWDCGSVERDKIPISSRPIAGPEPPTTITGYDSESWKLEGANFAPLFADLEKCWPGGHLKVKFGAVVSGHPRREVHSSWIRLSHLSIMFPENQCWIEGDTGLPQFRE